MDRCCTVLLGRRIPLAIGQTVRSIIILMVIGSQFSQFVTKTFHGKAGPWTRVYFPERMPTNEPYVVPRLAAREPAQVPERKQDVRPVRVFLCHSAGDKSAVRELYKRLLTDGFDPWLDTEKLTPGKLCRPAIERAIRTSDAVVVCLSQRSIIKEGFVQKEIKQALDVATEKLEDTVFLIPLRLEECQVPERLSDWQWVDMYGEGGYSRLFSALHSLTDSR